MKPNRLTAFLLFFVLPVSLMTIAWHGTGFAIAIILLALAGWIPSIGTGAIRFIANLMSVAGVIGIIIAFL